MWQTSSVAEPQAAISFGFIDRRVMAAVERVAGSDPDPGDPFRGLYISDEVALRLTHGDSPSDADERLQAAARVTRFHRSRQRVIREYLVHDQRGIVRHTKIRHRYQLIGREHGTRRIVRAHRQHCAHRRLPGAFQFIERHGPSAVVLEPVLDWLDAVQRRQVVKQRVARHRHHHRTARRLAQ